ncbi:Surfeit locus protein 2 (SURF2), partial [Thalictrum thalictroides]
MVKAAKKSKTPKLVKQQQENGNVKEGFNLLGSPTFEKLENGRFKCLETGHEMLPKDKELYSNSKRCRLGLIDAALSQKKPPLNMFKQDPHCKLKVVCKLTGDIVNKTEEHIWKHINGKRFLNKL